MLGVDIPTVKARNTSYFHGFKWRYKVGPQTIAKLVNISNNYGVWHL